MCQSSDQLKRGNEHGEGLKQSPAKSVFRRLFVLLIAVSALSFLLFASLFELWLPFRVRACLIEARYSRSWLLNQYGLPVILDALENDGFTNDPSTQTHAEAVAFYAEIRQLSLFYRNDDFHEELFYRNFLSESARAIVCREFQYFSNTDIDHLIEACSHDSDLLSRTLRFCSREIANAPDKETQGFARIFLSIALTRWGAGELNDDSRAQIIDNINRAITRNQLPGFFIDLLKVERVHLRDGRFQTVSSAFHMRPLILEIHEDSICDFLEARRYGADCLRLANTDHDQLRFLNCLSLEPENSGFLTTRDMPYTDPKPAVVCRNFNSHACPENYVFLANVSLLDQSTASQLKEKFTTRFAQFQHDNEENSRELFGLALDANQWYKNASPVSEALDEVVSNEFVLAEIMREIANPDTEIPYFDAIADYVMTRLAKENLLGELHVELLRVVKKIKLSNSKSNPSRNQLIDSLVAFIVSILNHEVTGWEFDLYQPFLSDISFCSFSGFLATLANCPESRLSEEHIREIRYFKGIVPGGVFEANLRLLVMLRPAYASDCQRICRSLKFSDSQLQSWNEIRNRKTAFQHELFQLGKSMLELCKSNASVLQAWQKNWGSEFIPGHRYWTHYSAEFATDFTRKPGRYNFLTDENYQESLFYIADEDPLLTLCGLDKVLSEAGADLKQILDARFSIPRLLLNHLITVSLRKESTFKACVEMFLNCPALWSELWARTNFGSPCLEFFELVNKLTPQAVSLFNVSYHELSADHFCYSIKELKRMKSPDLGQCAQDLLFENYVSHEPLEIVIPGLTHLLFNAKDDVLAMQLAMLVCKLDPNGRFSVAAMIDLAQQSKFGYSVRAMGLCMLRRYGHMPGILARLSKLETNLEPRLAECSKRSREVIVHYRDNVRGIFERD